MGDDLMSIPVPSTDNEQPEAWKKAMEALNKVTKKSDHSNGHGSSGQNNNPHGMFPWMNPSQFPISYSQNGAAPSGFGPPNGSFGGGWHPSTWNSPGQMPIIPPPPNQQNYNQQGFHYNDQQQQNWNGYGRGRGRGKQNNWNQNQQQQYQANKFQPFTLNKRNNPGIPHITSSFVSQGGQNSHPPMGRGFGGQAMPKPTPPSAQRYMERAFESANSPEEHEKVKEYIRKRLEPMLNAGTAHTVNWDTEPLPHERNYELPAMWTPANKLGYQPNGSHKKISPQNHQPKRRSDDYDYGFNGYGGNMHANESKRSRRESSSSDSDVIEIMSSSKRTKKKTKAEKKAEKLAAKRQGKQQKQQQSKKNQWRVDDIDNDSKRGERAKRFAETFSVVKTPSAASQHHLRRGQVVKGTCTDIEKSYFRLTAAPDPSVVRPLEVLYKSFENVKNKYRSKHEYRYLSSQLRSIRQDLTVQRIRNSFTVEVYEINARISLENKDREEFNQCQSQLKLLYSELENCVNHAEFLAYRLLYYIAMDNLIDINSLLQELNPKLEQDECVTFALKVRKSVASGNYIQLFKLFDSAPRMCPFIMDLFIERERRKALNCITKAFRPSISFASISKFLKMSEEELVEWFVEELDEKDAEIGGVLDCKNAKTF